MSEVVVKGTGVAACCCASLLSQAGCRIVVEPSGRAGSPVLMLSDQTQKLLSDVFDTQFLFQDAIRITKRVVRWGRDGEAIELPHSGLVMPESVLLARLWPTVNTETAVTESSRWAVVSSKQALPAVSLHEFGSRTAFTSSVSLNKDASRDSCWIESTESGWLFLLPSGGPRASLIAVGNSSEVLLAESRLVARQINGLGTPIGSFPAFPRVVTPLCGSGWIACGTAAVAFDPIAGEGAGNAIREGILAAAVIRAALQHPECEEALLVHYSSRMLSGFLRHLEECCHFYRAAGSEAWWRQEFEQLTRGVTWARNELSSNPKTKFRLVGFELLSIN